MRKLLNFEVFGENNSQEVVLIAHGLFGSLKNWRSIAKYLAESGRQVITVDMRNHGLSFWDDSHRYEEMAADLKDVISLFGKTADIVGHSMGGKAAMTLALLHSDRVKRLVVIDIAPFKYTHSQLNYIEVMESINLNSIVFELIK